MSDKKLLYITKLREVSELTVDDQARLSRVETIFPFRSNSYYQKLIDWDNPSDPIRRLVIPHEGELLDWGQMDASDEASFTVLPGLEHKYTDTVLLLVNNICGGFCRFCFRKRLFLKGNQEVVRDISYDLEYIRAHEGVSNVLLTGGDPLLMSTARLSQILKSLTAIDHVRIIRIGSKLTAFNPYRILHDPALLELFVEIVESGTQLYIMNHFNHPAELTALAKKTLMKLAAAGVMLTNQTPMIRGINDDPTALSTLFNELSYLGVPPYYVFQCRPTKGNFIYTVPLEQAYGIFMDAWQHCSGLARRARFVMSHKSGKIEVVGLTKRHILFRYHRAYNSTFDGKTVVCHRNSDGYWFDDFVEVNDT